MSKSRKDWDPAKHRAFIRKELGRRMSRIGAKLEKDAITLVSRDQPVRAGQGQDPSKPGSPPKVVYGRLRQSISHRVMQEPKKVTLRLGAGVDYAKSLEFGTTRMAPRPFLRPAVIVNRTFILGELNR